MRTWVSFSDLKPGARFRFVYAATLPSQWTGTDVWVKRRGGWFQHEDGGRSYRTGKLSAVEPVVGAVELETQR